MSAFLAPLFGAGWQGFDNQGNVLAGGKLYTYQAGTTSPYATWSDFGLTIPNGNPIILNSAGRPSSEIWFDSSSYKVVLTDTNNNIIGTWDNLVGMGSGSPGPQGNTGPQGPQGFTGAQGPLGFGPSGTDGMDGDDGQPIPGPKGNPGAQGVQGLTGPANMPGVDGVDGDDGMPIPGGVGPQGNPGAQGALGVTMAIPGDDGEDGLVVGLPGPQGNPGAQGAQGLTGPANMPGMDGVDGDDGMHIPGGVGPQGPQGNPGAQGVQGLTGPANMPGMDGVDGDDGMHIPGGVGPQGNTGAQGAIGPATHFLIDDSFDDAANAAVSANQSNNFTGDVTNSGNTVLIAMAVAHNWTGTQSFTGSTSVLASILTNAAEVCTVSATAATGTIAYYPSTQSVLYYTSNASANWTVNLTFSSGTTMNTALATGQSLTVTFLVTQGATAYYNSAVQVDGSTSGVTTKWQGGAPSAGNASGIDIYTYTIIKTASATFTVLASQTQFK